MNILIQNAEILTVNEQNLVIHGGVLGISGHTIAFVGTEVPTGFGPDRVIDAANGIVMPGLVNAHCHSPMTMFRNYTAGLPLHRWMLERNKPLQQFVTEADIRASAMLAYAEMIRSGTTLFADMYMWSEVLCEVCCTSGLRAQISGPYGLAMGLTLQEQLHRAEVFGAHLAQASNGRIRETADLHSVYGASEEQMAFMAEFLRSSGMALQIHVAETERETRQIAERFDGATALEVMERFQLTDGRVLAAHCVQLTDRDYDLLRTRPIYPVHCPSSNLYLGSGIADVPKLLRMGIPVCLGTDGAGSNNTLNMLQEVRLAGLLHKGSQRDPAQVPPTEVIRMATINGAKALGLDQLCGSLEPGKRADLILLRTDTLNMTPLVDVRNAVAYSAQSSDVSMTMVDGEILMENGRLTRLDEGALCEAAARASANVLRHGGPPLE